MRYFNQALEPTIISQVTPLTISVQLAMTAGDTFLVSRILRALKTSDNLRNRISTHRQGKRRFLIGLVLLMIFSQVTRFTLHISKITLYGMEHWNIYNCMMKANERGNEREIFSCFMESLTNVANMELAYQESLIYCLEPMGMCMLMTWKKLNPTS